MGAAGPPRPPIPPPARPCAGRPSPSPSPMTRRLALQSAVVLGALLGTILCPSVGGPLPLLRSASAADAPPAVEVPLLDGTTIRGVVTGVDAKEVAITVGEVARKVAWSALSPLGVFRVRVAVAAADDGAVRLGLAELASELGLWAEARAEYEKALALRAIDARTYEKAVADAELRAVEAGIGRATKALEAGDTRTALAALRQLKLDFAGAANAAKVDALLGDLSRRVAASQAEQLASEEDRARALRDGERQKEVTVRFLEAKQHVNLAAIAAEEMRAQAKNGVVSRVRRLGDASDAGYVAARRALGRIRRLTARESPDALKALAMLGTIDRDQFRMLLDATKFFWEARVYAPAEDFAARASYVDPVDPALLEVRAEIRSHRIRYRASDVTNAFPR